MANFYCYALLDSRKPGNYLYKVGKRYAQFKYEPFYIGKGKGTRCEVHTKYLAKADSRSHKVRRIRLILREGGEVLIVRSFTKDEDAAFRLEKALILSIGRAALTNMTDGGEGYTGGTPSRATRKKLSEALLGFKRGPQSEQHKAKLAVTRLGKKLPPRTRAQCRAISERQLGVAKGPMSDAHKQKISESSKGWPKPPRTKAHSAAISAAKLGKPVGPPSQETRIKISSALKGKPKSPAAVEKMRASLTGVPWSKARRDAHLKSRSKKCQN